MRGIRWKTWAYCAAAAGLKVWLVAPQAVSVGAKNSLQWLYLLVAQEFVQGHWFGASHRIALRFPPGYSLWIAINDLLGIPLRLGIEFLLALAAFAFLLALRRLRVPEILSCLLFTAIVFDPATFALFQKTSPHNLAWPLTMLAASCYFLSTYAEKSSSKDWLRFLAGLFLAAYWLSQTSLWVPLLLVAWALVWEFGLYPPAFTRFRRLILVLPVLGLLAGPTLLSDLLVRGFNEMHYGRFALQSVSILRSDELARFQEPADREKLFQEMAGNRPSSQVLILETGAWSLECQARSAAEWTLGLPERFESPPPACFPKDSCVVSYLDENGVHWRIPEPDSASMPAKDLNLAAAALDPPDFDLREWALEAIPRWLDWAPSFLLFSMLLTAPIVAWNRLRTAAPKSGDFWLFLFSGLVAISLAKALGGDWRDFDWKGLSNWPLATAAVSLGLLLLDQAAEATEAWTLSRPSPQRPERWFLGFALVFGLFFVFANPPMQAPDEIRHAFRSYQVSEGLPRSAPIPQSLVTVHSRFESLPFRPANKVSVSQILDAWKIPLNPGHRDFHGSTGSISLPNLPQGLGMFLGRHLGLPALGLMYMGRLFNLFFWIAMVYLAIRQLPFYRWMFCFAALSPMGLYQASSLSYDGFTNGICFLLTSTFLSFAYGSTPIRVWKVVAMFVQGAMASLAKVLYFPLTLLYLLIPTRRFGSKLRYALVFFLLLLSSWGVDYLWSAHSGKVRMIVAPGPEHPHGNLSFILHHPMDYLALIGRTLREHGEGYLQSVIGSLGWTDTHMPIGLLFLYGLAFILIARWDNRPGLRLGLWPRALALAVVVLVSGAIFSFFYLTWSPVEASTILGLQGRYFIPIVPALALLFYSNRGEGRRLPELDVLAPWLSGLILAVTAAVLLVRYYSW